MDNTKRINIKITIQYDGSKFYGFQRQKNARTVQKEIEDCLKKIFDEDIKIKPCGRTDSGVHAFMHVSNFFVSNLKIPVNKLAEILTNELPKDIVCLKAEIVNENFNSRYDAKSREYLYIIHNSTVKSPFYRKRAWFINNKISIRKLKKTLSYIKGTHDFKSFCVNNPKTNSIRTIKKIKVKKKKDKIFIYIKGYAFLHKMIRMIIGCAIEITLNDNYRPKKMKEIIDLKSRKKNKFTTAPAYGLYLYKIEY